MARKAASRALCGTQSRISTNTVRLPTHALPSQTDFFFLPSPGLHEEGLFRRSPSSALLRAAQEAYDRGNVVSLESFGDPHLAAVLIKKFLRDLPSPVFGEGMYGVISGCPMPLGNGEEGEECAVRYVREEVLPLLAPCAYILLSSILRKASSSFILGEWL